jgi:hypothetical protein
METDMSPFDDSLSQPKQDFFPQYNPQVPQPPQFHQTHQEYFPSYPQQPKSDGLDGFFSSISKSTWIIIAILFIVGFFMGKTMQPVFIKTG